MRLRSKLKTHSDPAEGFLWCQLRGGVVWTDELYNWLEARQLTNATGSQKQVPQVASVLFEEPLQFETLARWSDAAGFS